MNWHSLTTLVREGWREPSTVIGVGLAGVVLWFADADMIREAGERLDALAGTLAKAGGAVAALVLILKRDKPNAVSSD